MRILKKENEEDKNACDLQAFFVLHLRCPLSGFLRIGHACPMRKLPWGVNAKRYGTHSQQNPPRKGRGNAARRARSAGFLALDNPAQCGNFLGSACLKISYSLPIETAPSGAKCRTAGARTFGVSSPSAEASHESTCLKVSHLFSIGCAKREAVPGVYAAFLFSALLFSSFLFFSLSRDVSIFVRFVYIFA